MKKSIKRIISFALMLSLLVGMMAGFTAFAAETETVEIISKNLYYGDTFNIMYAVNSTSDDVVLNIYTMNDKGELELAVTVDEYITDTVKGVENAKVFTSAIGVPAQNIDKEFYAQAVAGNTKSEMVKYSVLEYLYERLYVSEGVSEEQKTMYNSLLAFADAADVVVNKDTTTNISKYAYVRVTNGTVDGTNTAAMVLGGTALEFVNTDLVAGKGMKIVWEVAVDNVTKTVEEIAEYVTEAGKAYTLTAKEVEDDTYVEETFVDVTTSVVIGDYATANGWVNENRYDSVNINALVTAVAAYKTGAQYTGGYYTNQKNWRFYQTENATLTISAGEYNIVSVKFEFAYENKGLLMFGEESVKSGDVVLVGAPSATFSVSDTNDEEDKGQIRFTKIEVVYQVPAHDCQFSAATCTAPKICSVCGATDGEALGHAYDDGTVTTKPTCTTNGVKTFTCTTCSVTKTEVIPFTGHTTENGTCDNCGEQIGGSNVEALVNAQLSFANKAQRTAFSTSEQVWEQNGVKFINKKASSSNNVADYASPVRCYQNSSITVEGAGIKKIVFDCNSGSYATALKNSIGTVTGATVTVSSDKVTVEFATAVDTFTIAKLTAQVRIDSITIN